MARPRKYESDAQRQAAYRQREQHRVFEVRVVPTTADTLDRLASALDTSRNEVVNSLIIYALLNRDWFKLGLFGKRLPRAQNPTTEE